MADNNAQGKVQAHIDSLLTPEEAKVVAREATGVRVRERLTLEETVAFGRRKGNAVCNRALDPTKDLSDLQVITLALSGDL